VVPSQKFREHYPPDLAARAQTRSIASAPDVMRESRSDQVAMDRGTTFERREQYGVVREEPISDGFELGG